MKGTKVIKDSGWKAQEKTTKGKKKKKKGRRTNSTSLRRFG